MTQALAQALADRLALLPFLDPAAGARVAGLARLWTGTAAGDDAPTVRVPVPAVWSAEECVNDPRYLLPSSDTPAIVFFEDGGTIDYSIAPGIIGKESALRLLLWLNPARLSAPLSEAQLIAAIEKALKVRVRHNEGEYRNLLITAAIPPAETALFGRYTHDTGTPLLLPPYRLLGLNLTCRYLPAPACPADELPTILPASSCLQSTTVTSSFRPLG